METGQLQHEAEARAAAESASLMAAKLEAEQTALVEAREAVKAGEAEIVRNQVCCMSSRRSEKH